MDGIHSTNFTMGSYSCLQEPGLVKRLISLTFNLVDLNTKIPKQLFSEHLNWLFSFGTWLFEEMQKSKMAVWGGLTNSCEKKRREKQRRKGKI